MPRYATGSGKQRSEAQKTATATAIAANQNRLLGRANKENVDPPGQQGLLLSSLIPTRYTPHTTYAFLY